jgi:hypothetical protein
MMKNVIMCPWMLNWPSCKHFHTRIMETRDTVNMIGHNCCKMSVMYL